MRLQNASNLKHRVEVWYNGKSDKPNRLGQYENVPKQLTTMWAAIIPKTYTLLRGRTADTELLNTTHIIQCRYREDITSDMWIMYKGKRYNITYVMDKDFNNKTLEIYCEVVI